MEEKEQLTSTPEETTTTPEKTDANEATQELVANPALDAKLEDEAQADAKVEIEKAAHEVDEAALDAALAAQTEADAVEDKAEGIVEKVESTIEEMHHALVARVQSLEDRLLNHNTRSGHKI